MEDKRQWFACDECDGEFAVETDCGMSAMYCIFCGEPLDDIEWNSDYEDAIGEGEGTQTSTMGP